MNEKTILSVSQINRNIKNFLERVPDFKYIFVKGEISNFVAHGSGIYYFSLKDNGSRIKAIMFSTFARNVPFELKNGLSVIAQASVVVYEPDGSYQLQVTSVELAGAGDYKLQFEMLKEKLFKEGLFAEERKLKLPCYPMNIGLISGLTSAALQDLLATINRRWPVASVRIYPSLVQGKEAAKSLVESFKVACEEQVDVIIFARGGGSYEDLIAFNDEELARIVSNSKIPTISGIGHEIDFTILDFVASVRAPTPTAAAELATPSILEVKQAIKNLSKRLLVNIFTTLERKKRIIDYYKNHYLMNNGQTYVFQFRQKCDGLNEKMKKSFKDYIENNRRKQERMLLQLTNSVKLRFNNLSNRFSQLSYSLNSHDYNKIFEKGFVLIKNSDNKLINDIKSVKINETISIQFKKGHIDAKVQKIEE